MNKANQLNKIINEMAIPRGFKKLGTSRYKDEYGYEYEKMPNGTWTVVLLDTDQYYPVWRSDYNRTIESARQSASFHRTKDQVNSRRNRMGLPPI